MRLPKLEVKSETPTTRLIHDQSISLLLVDGRDSGRSVKKEAFGPCCGSTSQSGFQCRDISSEKAQKYKQAMPSAILEISTKINSLDLGKRCKKSKQVTRYMERVTVYALWVKVHLPRKKNGFPGFLSMVRLGEFL